VTLRNRWELFVVDPPFEEGLVGAHIEALFGWGCLRERVAYVRAINNEVLRRSDGVK
jgi:hypothetical protein